jgi:vanillate/3-O-methylgallate O-demethylase
VGREALAQMADQPHRQKVWLIWDRDEVMRVVASSLFDDEQNRAKFLDTPLGRYARVHCDTVLVGDKQIGISTVCAYTTNIRSWFSVAFIDPADVRDGSEVEIVWGEENGGTAKRNVEPHKQTTIRATMKTERPSVISA